MTSNWECIIVGGGAAGLSAALVLGRARRRTLVIDAGGQSNRPAEGIGGLLGHDHRPPADFYETARAELAAYPSVELRDATVTEARRDGEGFVVDGERTGRLILATGMDYRLPDIPGVAERWGRSVFHCPFCHGWEHRDEALVILGEGPEPDHRLGLLALWSDDVTYVDQGDVSHVEDDAVVMKDGSRLAYGGALVPVKLHQRGGLAAQLGAEIAEPGPVAHDAVVVDARFRTSVPGLYAAGDASAQMQSVAAAVAAGHMAAATVVADYLMSPVSSDSDSKRLSATR